MSQYKSLASGFIAACLVIGAGNLVLADGAASPSKAETKAARKRAAAKVAAQKRGVNAATPAMAGGIAGTPDTGMVADPTGTVMEYKNALGQTVYEISPSGFDISQPLSDMAAAVSAVTQKNAPEFEPVVPQLPPWRITRSDVPDPVVQAAPTASDMSLSGGITPAAPTTGFNFTGIGTSGASPSDSNGTVGWDGTTGWYFETVNTKYAVWTLNHATNTATALVAATNISAVWSGFTAPCSTQNAGDPIVLWDKVAQRWLISQFTSTASGGNYYQCVAVSTTSSPNGTYARWQFVVPNSYFGDYPKIATWSDAYYMSAHAFTAASGGTYAAAIFAAMDRTKMLAGNAGATWQVILDPSEGGHLPADLDSFAPPPTNAPGIFLSLHTAGMQFYRMKVDFVTPANTAKTPQAIVPIASWTDACANSTTVGTCIPQPGTTQLLDSLGGRLMYRAAYRNFVDHESLVVTHSVDPGVTGLVAGVRWYDFRLSGQPDAVCSTYPCLRQQSTLADAANGRNRWMGSAAMDGAENMLLGYSVSGKTANSENQSIRYTSRAKGDTLGTMTGPEATIGTGTKNNTTLSRWGDYTSMSSDPFDDCTFWYVAQYIPSTANSWVTKIASATFPAGTGAGQCSPSTCTARPASAPTIGTASVAGANQIAVTWTGISPTPGSYAIERAVGACGSEGLYQPLTSVAGTSSSFTDTTPVGGYTYSYRVIAATDAGGKCQSTLVSGCASATATGTCSLKPVFGGTTSGTSNNTSTCGVNVNWTAATSSCPLTPNVKYNVFRGTTPDFVPSVANRIATCVTGPTSYLDQSSLTSGVTYYYVVRAEDSSTGNGGECAGGNEETNSIVTSGTAYGVGTQASPGTWTDGGGDGTAFLLLNVATTGDTADKSWRFVSTATDAGANHTGGGSYAYRNAGPTSAAIYTASTCTEIQTPPLTIGATSTNLTFWERHQLEYNWDGIAVEYSRNGGAWTDMPAPSNATAAGCVATDVTSDYLTLSCTGAPPANACNYASTKAAYTGPLGSGTACASWVTSATVSSYAHRCQQLTGLTAGDTLQFRWRFASDPGADYAGMYLDDVAVTNVRLPNSCSSNPCLGQADGTACNDGNACTTGETCQSQVCTGGTATVCTASDQCHVAGTCDPASGICSNPNAGNGTACSDGNACTQTDTCQSGVCTGSNAVVCTAIDQCHTAGTCAPATGVCSNPAKANGSACSDGNACTVSDTCQSGACAGGAPVVCTASDQCHVAGTCNPGTGTCSNPNATDGTACNDGNACTQTDACQSGVCTGTNPVTCTASDQCHVAGTCNPANGTCSNPNAANGTACNDGNACTQTDTCQTGVCAGGNPVTCTASDQCHVAGTCNPGTGTCSNPAAADGTSCNDGNACTQTDTCQTGVCAGSNPVTCTASDQCHVAGTCDPQSGTCSNPAAANGTACNDGNACTQTDTCQAGVCAGSNPVTCTASDQCHVAGTCNPANGTCSNPNAANGTACNDGNACTQTDTCQTGVCAGGNPVTCTASDQCHVAGTCDPQSGTCSNPAAADGTTCNDGNACTQTDTCQTGVCAGSNPVTCTASDQCHVAGTCDPQSGACSNPNAADGTACNDGNACTQSDSCQAGTCTGGNPVVCAASDQCHAAGTCDPQTGACSNPNVPDGTTCTDGGGDQCATSHTCEAGVCTGGNPVVCTALDQCHGVGTCNPQTGQCSNPPLADGTSCNDGSACTQSDACQAGTCVGSNPVTCTASDACHVAGTCNPATGTCSNPSAPDGTACSDGNACTQADSCQSGSCVSGPLVTCTASDQCHVAGTCNPFTGSCSNPVAPNGRACNDGNACTLTDACQAGTCVGGNPVTCTASDQCHVAGSCNPGSGTCSNPAAADGTACDDGNACTVNDNCVAGSCSGGTAITAPPETQGVTASSDKSTYTWATALSATQYDVVRGGTGALPVGPGGGDEVCFDNLTGATLVDPANPAPGSGFWYLSRGKNACGAGSFGTQSNGTPRVTTTCP